MWCRLLFVACYFAIVNSVAVRIQERTASDSKYSIEKLLTTIFPAKTSDDLDLDPCKAGKAMF